MPISPDLAIFVVDDDDKQTDRRQAKPIALPLAHARGVIIMQLLLLMHKQSMPTPLQINRI